MSALNDISKADNNDLSRYCGYVTVCNVYYVYYVNCPRFVGKHYLYHLTGIILGSGMPAYEAVTMQRKYHHNYIYQEQRDRFTEFRGILDPTSRVHTHTSRSKYSMETVTFLRSMPMSISRRQA